MTSRIAAVLVLSVALSACATAWREHASSAAVGCPAGEILISDPTSGAITNTWRAQCKGKVYRCSVPAIAEPDAPATCMEDPSAPVLAVPAPSVPLAPVAPVTVFLFVRDKVASVARPLLELRGFGKIVLQPGETGTVELSLPASELRFLGIDLAPVFEPGEVEILVGPCADRARLLAAIVQLQA